MRTITILRKLTPDEALPLVCSVIRTEIATVVYASKLDSLEDFDDHFNHLPAVVGIAVDQCSQLWDFRIDIAAYVQYQGECLFTLRQIAENYGVSLQ